MEFDLMKIQNLVVDMATTYGLRLLGSVIVLVVGLFVIKRVVSVFNKVLNSRGVDSTLRPFLSSLTSTLLKVLLGVSVLGMLGIEMTSFIAVLGAAGLAVGMALSGTLQNFAGGVLILLLKPFKKGDVIEAQGFVGTVDSIQIFHTSVKTVDNKTIILPNGPLSTGSLVNYSTEALRRVDMKFGIAYGDDVDTARNVLNEMIAADTRVLADPAPFVAVSELADSSVNFVVRLWVNQADYWGVYFDFTENVYKNFPKNRLNIPFPQMDVHVHNG